MTKYTAQLGNVLILLIPSHVQIFSSARPCKTPSIYAHMLSTEWNSKFHIYAKQQLRVEL
jgi:hypothetical protein